MSIPMISPEKAKRLLDSGAALIDVRTPAEFEEVHAAQARLVPLDALDAAAIAAERKSAGGALCVVCKSGGRASKACQKLIDAGVPDALCVEGGMTAWIEAGLPVIRGKKTISLERQVRIAAGSLVVIGVALGHWAHPAFFALSAFVGAGLVFAGVTDTCGMAMLLTKMPWNQRGCAGSCCAK